MNELGAVILAAGLSSRMGDFKPLLQIGGETLIGRVISMMKNAGAEPVVVVTGYRKNELEEYLKESKESDVVFVHNERFRETQMLESFLLGFDAVGGKCGRILVSPSDVPLVKQETVRALLQQDGKFVRPMYDGQPGHPVLLSSEIIPEINQYKGPGGLRGAVESCGIEIIGMDTDDKGVVLDCDTKEDYEYLMRYFSELCTQGG